MTRLIATSVMVAALTHAGAGTQSGRTGLTRQTWTIGGVKRSALVAAPRTSSQPAPLVFVFHGHGGTSAHAARTFAIHTHWPGAIVIYPQGLPTVGRVIDPEGRLPGWQHAPGDQGDRDLRFVDTMLGWARKQYRVDDRRVFASGHSNGGSMTYALWAARADVFAAFAPSSSVFPRDYVAKATPKPAFVVIGEQDALVPAAAQRRNLAALLQRNGAATTGTPWSGLAVRHVSSVGADVIAYIHPGGHPMPSDTGALIVQFFRSLNR